MKKRAHELANKARQHRASGKFLHAGDLYTAAAHEHAGTVTEHIFPGTDRTYAAVSTLLDATLCYRLASDDFRTQNRCKIGTLLAEDYIEHINQQEIEPGSFADVRRGSWPEFIGDLRTIAKRQDAEDAYDQAKDIYNRCSGWEFVMGEKEHMTLAAFFRSVKRGAGYEISRDAPEQQSLDERNFSEWLEYKRERLPQLLDEIEAQGEWPTETSDSENAG